MKRFYEEPGWKNAIIKEQLVLDKECQLAMAMKNYDDCCDVIDYIAKGNVTGVLYKINENKKLQNELMPVIKDAILELKGKELARIQLLKEYKNE